MKIEIVLANFQPICDFMMTCLKQKDQKLALAATEFWSGFLSIGYKENE